MARNTVSRVESESTSKREKARRKAIADMEREAARPWIGADRGTSVPIPSRTELRDMATQDVHPTDAAAKGFALNRNYAGVAAMGAIKAAELFGVGKQTTWQKGLALRTKRRLADGRPVAERPIDATPEQREAFDDAIMARNRVKRHARSSGSTVERDAARHDVKVKQRVESRLGQDVAPRALKAFIQGRQFQEVAPGLIEIPIKSGDLADARVYVGTALDRSNSRTPAPWCTLSDPTGLCYTKYLAVPQALYVNVKSGKPVAYRASDLFADASIRQGIPLYYDLKDEAHRNLADAVRPETSRSRVKDTRDPQGSIRWMPASGNDALRGLDRMGDSDADLRQRLMAAVRTVSPDEAAELPPPPPELVPADLRLLHEDLREGGVPFALKAGRTRRNTRAAEGGGDAGSETAVSETPVSEAPQNPGGPRIVINPQVFNDKRDALCVTFNEAFRVVMELNGFEPVSEPTEAQRKFFSDTAYADDELQLRRTILARIATLDTSVKDPTDEQLEETAEMLEMVMEVGAPQNEWEQSAVKRLHDVVVKSLESTRANGGAEGTSQPLSDMV